MVPVARGAVIGGTITMWNGEPAVHIPVALMSAAADSYEPQIVVATDKQGVFRASGLPPDDYFVAAAPQSAGSGGVLVPTTAEVTAALAAASDQSRANVQQESAASEPVLLGPSYFPGTSNSSEAVAVSAGVGSIREGVDFRLSFSRTFSVEGRVTTEGAALPPGIRVIAKTKGPSLPPRLTIGLNTGRVAQAILRGDGTFVFESLLQGDYQLVATTPARRPNGGDQTALWATTDVSVFAAVSGINLVLRRSLSMTGHLSADYREPRVADMSENQILVTAVAGGISGGGATARPLPIRAPVSPIGDFKVEGLIPGHYRVSILPGLATLSLRSVSVGGRTVPDQVVVLGRDDITDVQLLASDRDAELRGTFPSFDAGSDPSHVLLMAIDPALRSAPARLVFVTRPDESGRFRLRNIPPGDYLVGRVDNPGDAAELVARSVPPVEMFRIVLKPDQVSSIDLPRRRQQHQP
jgi:hypothetical protein